VPPDYQGLFGQLAGASEDNTVTLPTEVFQGAFMGDADPATAALVHSVLRAQPYLTFTNPPVGGNDYRTLDVPLHYVLSADDVALPPGEFGWAPRMPERIGATPIEVPGSHEACFTRPADLAAGISPPAERPDPAPDPANPAGRASAYFVAAVDNALAEVLLLRTRTKSGPGSRSRTGCPPRRS